jgi:hypothetical protein
MAERKSKIKRQKNGTACGGVFIKILPAQVRESKKQNAPGTGGGALRENSGTVEQNRRRAKWPPCEITCKTPRHKCRG